jgi:ferredoxin-thioredoxin reductase catalytic subunit
MAGRTCSGSAEEEHMEFKDAEVNELSAKLGTEGEAAGYYLNPDVDFVKELIRGLLTNQRRYGYQACPCRLASGDAKDDLDIVCPCDYRDADVAEFGACY